MLDSFLVFVELVVFDLTHADLSCVQSFSFKVGNESLVVGEGGQGKGLLKLEIESVGALDELQTAVVVELMHLLNQERRPLLVVVVNRDVQGSEALLVQHEKQVRLVDYVLLK